MTRDDVFGFSDDLHEVLVERARSLRPMLENAAAENEIRGELTPGVVDAITDAGFFAMFAPRRCGGLGVSCKTMMEVSVELAKACPSTAWVVSIITNNTWTASTFADPVQRRMFACGVPIICGPQYGMGKIESDGGGFFASGRWGYGSGSHHSTWAIMPCLMGEDPCMVAVPMSEVRIERDWDVAGMKGTGSDTVVAEKVRLDVDQIHRILPPDKRPRSAFEPEPSDYWIPFPTLRVKALSIMLGIAEGLVEAILAGVSRPIVYSAFEQRQNSPVWVAGVGEAAATIAAVRTILTDHAHRVDNAALARRPLDYAERAALRGEGAVATRMLEQAVDRLMSLAGSGAYRLAEPAQRLWRDFSVGARHIVLNTELGFEVYGRSRMGMDPKVVMPEFV